MPLPQPDDLTSLVLRTDFGDEGAWNAVRAALDAADDHPHATYLSDPDISANLSIANMYFAEFADAADASGTFRGFDQG
ncbi:DUF6924 domain-containing protein [Streptomyces longwoodensis]